MLDDDRDVRLAHNWCDRWCERCPLQSRCPIGRKAPSSEEGFIHVANAMARAKAMLEVELARAGVEVVAFDDVEALADWQITADHPLSIQAHGWFQIAAAWLRTAPEGEAQEVVGWYHTVVPPKVRRALQSAPGEPDDARGSAKVATLGLGRVIHELTNHCARCPFDHLGLELLSVTADLLDDIEAVWPNHMAFRRPGLD